MNFFDWLLTNWISIVIPVAIFLAFVIIALWIRRAVFRIFYQWLTRVSKGFADIISQTMRTPFFHWFIILGAYIAIQISITPPEGKVVAGKILFSLFTISLFWVIANIIEKLLQIYLIRVKLRQISFKLIITVIRIALIVTGVLILLDIWGAPTTPILLIIATLILIAVLAAREFLLNVFSGFELAKGTVAKTGDYIRLSSGEEGYVMEISWQNTLIKTLHDHIIVIPNSKLAQSTITNYGRPLKQATNPFQFYTRLHLKELTGKKASNLIELREALREMPDSVIYYHTHRFLQEHHYLTPEPTNDFALWVGDVLDDQVLAEKLANIDIFEFTSIHELKTRIVAVIDEYMTHNKDLHNAPEGRELHFIKSISVIAPTQYVAHDLREFIEIMRKVTVDSLYFHMFESRLRLAKGVNDYSTWLKDCLGEDDLASQIAVLDPYNLTLENLRIAIIQLIEKRIK